MSLVSIVIRAFNEDRHIGRLMDGISRQQLPDGWGLEVILVDSGSTDSTVSIAEHMGARTVRIGKNEFSFGRALNRGCAEANGDILVFASAHVYPVYTDWLEKMIAPFTNPKIGLVYGRQVGNDVTRFSEHQVFNKWFPPTSNYKQSTPFCNNANCAVRRSLWKEQPFDEFLTGLEDLDWANKIMARHLDIVYEAEAPIVHVHEETLTKIKNRYRREAMALKQIFPKVRFSSWDFLRLFAVNTFTDLVHALRNGLFLREFKGIVGFRLMQFYGTYIGHNRSGEVTRELKTRFYYPGSVLVREQDKTENNKRLSKKIEYF